MRLVRGPAEPVPVGSPPWMTKPGTMRWKNVSSKKPRLASETSEAVALGDAFWSSVTVKSPQFVAKTSRYFFEASSFRCSSESFRSSWVFAVASSHPPCDALVFSSLPPPPPQAASRKVQTTRIGVSRFTGAMLAARIDPMDGGPIRYARSGDVNIAYQVTGDGPIDLVLIHGFFSHLELDWEHPASRHVIERLSSFARLIRFDKRGTGLSDRSVGMPDFEARMDDVRGGHGRGRLASSAALFGYSEGGPLSVLFAAAYPARTHALVLYGTYAKRLRSDDYPWAPTWEERVAIAQELERTWGESFDLGAMAPNAPPDLVEWAGRRGRAGLSPRGVRDLILMNSKADVRDVLPRRAGADARPAPHRRPRRERRGGAIHRRAHPRRAVRRARRRRPHRVRGPGPDPRRGRGVPHRRRSRLAVAESRARDRALHRPRRLDGAGARARRPRAGRELLERHDDAVRRELARFGGEEVDTAGDGFFALVRRADERDPLRARRSRRRPRRSGSSLASGSTPARSSDRAAGSLAGSR